MPFEGVGRRFVKYKAKDWQKRHFGGERWLFELYFQEVEFLDRFIYHSEI